MSKKDYSLTGKRGQEAVKAGLATAAWYHSDVPQKTMKQLMRRTDGPALRDTAIWLGIIVGCAAITTMLWPSLWSLPFLLVYGVLYASGGDARWHECGHGTAFRTRWMNRVVYHIASFMIIRNPIAWKWSHVRHHTDTIIVGRDPEIAVMRPPDLARLMLNFFGVCDALDGWKIMLMNSVGVIDEDAKTYIPESEYSKIVRVARIWLVIYAAVALLAWVLGSWLPIILVFLPKLYGSWHVILTGTLQHAGLAEDVLDHRLNTRTVYLNPFSRFVYMNMNYHVEHHMFPMVPYYALPQLHELIRHDLPEPNSGLVDAYKEVWPALLRQLRYEDWFIVRKLPATAKPYAQDLHHEAQFVEPALN